MPRLPGTTLVLLLVCLAGGCGGQKEVDLPAPPPSESTTPSPTATASAFTMPSDGDPIGGEVASRPADVESAEGAAVFAAWALSLLLHTPREDATTQLWSQVAGPTCEPCRTATGAWQQQASKGQVFRYARTPQLVRTVVRAQKQGDGWFVEYEAAVPRSTLSQGKRVLESAGAEHLDYTFTLSWADDTWRLDDFHVLG